VQFHPYPNGFKKKDRFFKYAEVYFIGIKKESALEGLENYREDPQALYNITKKFMREIAQLDSYKDKNKTNIRIFHTQRDQIKEMIKKSKYEAAISEQSLDAEGEDVI